MSYYLARKKYHGWMVYCELCVVCNVYYAVCIASSLYYAYVLCAVCTPMYCVVVLCLCIVYCVYYVQ